MLLALLLTVSASQREGPYNVEGLLAKMHTAYSKIHSVDMTVTVQLGNPNKYVTTDCRIRWMAPNLIREDISKSKESDNGKVIEPGFTFVCDGKQQQTIGRRDGKNGIKPFSPAAVQDDGAPVYKEALCIWDWKRQWSGEKGGKASGFRYQTAAPTSNGKKWIGLAETSPDKTESFQYYIDPNTYLIKRTLYYLPGDQGWRPVGNYVVTAFKPNVKLDRSIFTIKRS